MHVTHLQLRPATPPVIERCERCVFRDECGGIPAFTQFWNCFDQYPYKAGSDDVCPGNPEFANRLAEVRGLRFDNLGTIVQRPVDLPLYVPHLNHRYSRVFPLSWPVVSISPYELFRVVKGKYQPVVNDALELRTYFHLAPQTRIVLRGTTVDPPLERFWSYRKRDRAAEHLARLAIELMIGPNFSHFIDVPRTDNLFNRKRQLICLEEMVQAGVNPVPHLSAAVDGDWDFWGQFLRDHPTITVVAKELQTGNRHKAFGVECVQRIDGIQQKLGRSLHPVLIGGAQLVEAAAAHFARLTILDSRPFMNALGRRYFRSRGRRPTWVSRSLLPGFGIDDFVHENFERYSLWLALRQTATPGLPSVRKRHAG